MTSGAAGSAVRRRARRLVALTFASVVALGLSGCGFVAYHSPYAIKLEGDALTVLVCRPIDAVQISMASRKQSDGDDWLDVYEATGKNRFERKDAFISSDPPGFTVEIMSAPSFDAGHQLSIDITDDRGRILNGIFTFSDSSKPDADRWLYVGGEKTAEPCAVPTQ